MPDLEKGAQEIAALLDNGKCDEAADRLRSDFLNMQPGDFEKLVKGVDALDDKSKGDNIELSDKDEDGKSEVALKDILPVLSIEWETTHVIGTKQENGDTGTALGRNLQRVLGADDPYKGKVPEQNKR